MKHTQTQVGIIGLGRMGKCLLQGLLETGVSKDQLSFTTAHPESLQQASQELGIEGCSSNAALCKKADAIVFCVKPQNSRPVLQELANAKLDGKLFISIVTSLKTAEIEKALPGARTVRAMPNTPVWVREGITAFCLGKSAQKEDLQNVEALFRPLGRTVKVDESQLEAVTGLSGCGPAYFYLILEALADGGIKVGLPRELALELAAQTMLGAAKMFLETKRHPAELRDEVTTPAGCTIDGLLALEEGKLRVTLAKAVLLATERARSLGQG